MNTNIIIEAPIKGHNVSRLFKTDTTEVLLVTLEKNNLFPKHSSPKKTMIIVIEGSINFYIEHKLLVLDQNEIYNFNKNIEHHVTANDNSKFLIIR